MMRATDFGAHNENIYFVQSLSLNIQSKLKLTVVFVCSDAPISGKSHRTFH